MTIIADNMSAREAVAIFIRKYILDKYNEALGGGIDDFDGEYIVQLAPLYEWETPEQALFSNEYVHIQSDGNFCWGFDWDEGQTIVIIKGITPIEEVNLFWEL